MSHAYTSVKASLLPWIVCLTAALFFFYEFLQLNMFNAINEPLMADFGISATKLGFLSSAYFVANVLFLFPAGLLLDRYSTRRIILLAMFICLVGALLFAQTSSFLTAFIARFLIGMGSSFCFLSCVQLASRWFPPKRMALIVGWIVTFAMLGGAVAQTPMTLLTEQFGWREALQINAGIGFIILFLIFFIVKDYPAHYTEQHHEEKAHLKALGFLPSIKMVVNSRQTWFAGIYTSTLNLPLMILGGLWGISYLVNVYDLSRDQASYATTALFIGTIIGSPIAGWLSDRWGLRKTPMIIGAVMSVVLLFGIAYSQQLSFSASLCLFFLIGLVTSTQIIAYPLIAESTHRSITGTAVSLASVLIMSGPAIFEVLFGKLLEWRWDGTILNNIPVYSIPNYQLAMLIFPVMCVVSLLITFGIKETYCHFFGVSADA